MSCYFWWKNDECLKIRIKWRCEAIQKIKTPKVGNCIGFKMAISDLQNFEFLTPKNQKNDFFQKNYNKQKFQKYLKNRNICKRPKYKQNPNQISKQYLNF